MADKRVLRVGMIGLGGHGRTRRNIMRQSGLFQLVVGYDLSEEAMAEAAEQDGATPVSNYEALLDAPDLDVIVISTGAKFHAEQVLAALERGRHVFVEKPLCSTADEMNALVKMQHKTGLVVGMGHNDHRNDPVSRTLTRLMESEQFGALATFEATTCHSGGLLLRPGDWRGDPEKNPGGMLFQCGVHMLHELMHYFGPVDAVQCMMRYDVHTTATADVAQCILHFRSGLIGTLSAYHVSPYRHTLNIFGTGMNIYSNDRAFDEGVSILKQVEHLDYQKQPLVPVAIEGDRDPCSGMRSFHEAVVSGGEPYPSLLDGARAVAVVFAAEQAARTGHTVEVKLPHE